MTIDQINSAVSYDPETGIFTWRERSDAPKRWNTRYAGKRAFTSVDCRGYHQGRIGNQSVLPHRIAFALVHGFMPIGMIDHINGNKRDNRACNLREATMQQNQRNAGPHKDSVSRFRGVSKSKSRKNPWSARISNAAGDNEYLGIFQTEEAAARAYDDAAKLHHGEFARLNFQ